MKNNQIVIKNRSKSAIALSAKKAITDFIFKDFGDRKKFPLFNDYSFVDKYFSNHNKKLTIELSDSLVYRETSSNDTFSDVINEVNNEELLDAVLSQFEDPLIEDIYKEIENRKIKIKQSKKRIDKDKSKELFDKIIQSFLNRNIKYSLSGVFQVVRKSYYKIIIYYKTVKNDIDFNNNIKSTLSHELFHFNHCLSFNDDYKWQRSLDANNKSNILANVVAEGLATYYQLKYEELTHNSSYYEHFRFYSSSNMFNFYYSAFHMYNILSQYNDPIPHYTDISSQSFVRSFSEGYNKLFQRKYVIDSIAKRCLKMEE